MLTFNCFGLLEDVIICVLFYVTTIMLHFLSSNTDHLHFTLACRRLTVYIYCALHYKTAMMLDFLTSNTEMIICIFLCEMSCYVWTVHMYGWVHLKIFYFAVLTFSCFLQSIEGAV